MPSPAERAATPYVPPKYQPPRAQQMPRWKRNLLVWTLCAIAVIAAVLAFIYFMVPPESQRILDELHRQGH